VIGACQERWWDGETEVLGGLEVDDQLELGGLLYRKVGRLRALEDLIDEDGTVPKQREEVLCRTTLAARLRPPKGSKPALVLLELPRDE
jgi:hypothetical protein